MGSVSPTRMTLRAYSQLRFITPIQNACAAFVRRGPFRRDRFHGRSRADAERREESARAVRLQVFGRASARSAAPWPERSQYHPEIRLFSACWLHSAKIGV